MSKIPPYLLPGDRIEIGSYTFTKDAIIRFATKFDPQFFHLDEDKAKDSLMGGLCASGWHTASIWMKCLRAHMKDQTERFAGQDYMKVETGPSPGYENLQWLKPVFVDDTITYANQVTKLRESQSKPGWWVQTLDHEGVNQHGETVLKFTSSVFIHMRSPTE